MSDRIVRTQAELDKAVEDDVDWIEIRSERGVWIEVTAYDSATVTAYGSATVTASGSATVRAYGSATVTASGSATVTASGSATVTAYGSATVTASGSATVTAYDSATVTASGSATVTAYDSATVTASGSATVTAYDSATVRASSHVAVHLHSGHVKLDGGVLIDHTAIDETDATVWCEYHGVTVEDGIAQVFKAVDDQWTTSRGVDYSPGSTPSVTDDEWDPSDSCGGGLHFGPTPHHALAYHYEATKFVRVGVALADMAPVTGSTAKTKARRVVTPAVEVTVDGDEVQS